MNQLSLIWKTKDLRKKILFVLFLLLITRFIAHVPIPGVDPAILANALQGSAFLSLLDVFSGGGLANFSIAMLGVGPYITASIIMQLMTIIVPRLTEMQKEGGEAGRAKINQYTRWLTIPLAALQGYSTIRILQSSQGGSAAAFFADFSQFQWFMTILAIIAGTMLVMWIGELITEYGIGNGLSLIIFAGIVAQLPQSASGILQLNSQQDLPRLMAYVLVGLLVVAGVVLVTEAQRNIPISYARSGRSGAAVGSVNTHLPLRLNMAGVIPIIFAISVLLFPALIAQFFVNAKSVMVAEYANKVITLFNSQGYFYGISYFLMVVLFTYFYTAIVFNPDEVAENVQKNGGFIPGLRPGKQTADYLYRVLNRITLPGSVFLGLIALLPFILQKATGVTALSFGGTSLLIVVAVVIETIKQIQAQMTMHDYESL
ncbi:MAG TPA: preprotein translocase subunit SecY [Patescibacteria group bacterium]|nr:preprotein translocase subunit SecY [Patescibacteria group bacterium]